MKSLKKIILSLGLISASLSSSNSLEARIINVPQDYKTIQEAVDIAPDSDTISVSPGSYQENISINKKSISLISTAGYDSTKIIATNPDFASIIIMNSPDYLIDGFTIYQHRGVGIYSLDSNGRISQNFIYGANNAIFIQKGNSTDIWNNILELNNQAIVSNADSIIVEQNSIGYNGFSNGTPAVSLEGRINLVELNSFIDNRVGVKMSGYYNELFRNNFIRNTYGAKIDSTATKSLVLSNLFYRNYNTGLFFNGSNPNLKNIVVKCNGFYGNQFDSNLGLGKENYFMAPRFEEQEDYFRPLVKGSFYDRSNPCGSLMGAFDPIDEE